MDLFLRGNLSACFYQSTAHHSLRNKWSAGKQQYGYSKLHLNLLPWVFETDSTLLLYVKWKCGVKNCIPNFFQSSQLNSKDAINSKRVQHTAPLTISNQQFLFLILKICYENSILHQKRNESDKNTKTAWLTLTTTTTNA